MDLQTTVKAGSVIRFQELFGDDLAINVPLSRYTSARIGGPAEMLVTARDASTLLMAAELAYSQNIPYVVLGGGSNMLVSDAGISGLTIYNRARNTHFRHTGSRVVCTVESGMNLSLFARQCIGKGLGGLEWAVSVPGTVGGAVVGNSGAHGGDMSDTVISVTVWKPGVGIRTFNNDDLKYAYRTSMFKEEFGLDRPRMVVLSAEIELKSEPVAVLAARADGFTAHRKQTQPPGATMGSMFKNPENYYAGYLIDSAGLKGLQAGDAQISELHANFFVNNGDATAEDVRSLIAEAWHTVRDQFSVELDLEVELVGNWQFEEGI